MFKMLLFASSSLACTSSLAGERHCLGPGDLSADHVVNADDTALLLDCLAGPGSNPGPECPPEIALSADLDQDGDVDLLDVSMFTRCFGNSYFDYGPNRDDKESEHLAIKLTGELRAPDDAYSRIHRDLANIHERFSDTRSLQDTGMAADNGLIVALFSSYEHDEFDRLNSFYVARSVSGAWYRLVEYCDDLNPYALSAVYGQSEEVDYATPNQIVTVGCDHPDISITQFAQGWRYSFSFYYDSEVYPPCVCWRERVIQTDDAGNVDPYSCVDACQIDCP